MTSVRGEDLASESPLSNAFHIQELMNQNPSYFAHVESLELDEAIVAEAEFEPLDLLPGNERACADHSKYLVGCGNIFRNIILGTISLREGSHLSRATLTSGSVHMYAREVFWCM
jgi:hypothetical protein